MKKTLLWMALFQCCMGISFAQVQVSSLLCENRENPAGVDAAAPRLSWQLVSDKRDVTQTAYEVKVSTAPNGKGDSWSSGKVNSDSSVHVTYKGSALQPGKKYYWQVRVWDNSGKPSSWSTGAWWQMGVQAADWKAQWIQPGYTEDETWRTSPLLRKEFTTSKKIKHATAFITAHGLYEAQINGKRVGDAYLTPGWTSYNKRLEYQLYDVTDLLKQGTNAIGVTLGNGWYRGYLAWGGTKNVFGKDLGLLLQLQITYTDGSTETVISDGSWKTAKGPILDAEIYHGEWYDARREITGWALPGFKENADWTSAAVASFPNNNLLATVNEPIRKHEAFKPVKIFTTPKGEKVIDFGQNLVGWVMVKAKGNAGDKIVIQHAEVLDKAGNFYTENLRAARSTATYVLKGGGEEQFEPHFTFHGFRYIKVEGYPGELKPEDFTAVTLYSDMPPTGTFSTSNALINQLQHNIQWGQKGNFLDVPTDCPQRDERLGWTGDAQVFSRTASFNMNVNNFFAKWMKDVAADQLPNGSVPFVVPNVLGPDAGASAGWADVSTVIPWNMYLAYGDVTLLSQQYASMKAWVEYMHGKSKNDLWNTGFHFGDWLFYRPFDDNDGRSAVTDKYLIAQCFYAHSTQLLINAAKVLGNDADVQQYTALLQKIKAAFLKEYVTPSGRLVSSTQTAYVLALNFDMLPENLRAQAAEKLAANVKDYGNHLTTGFLGTPYLCHVLSRFGYTDVAFSLLMQESFPSWLYPVKMGATTIWERWNGIRTDSTFEPASMNSFNHYAYGAIGDWMYRVVAGLDTYEDGAGYHHIKVMPHIGGGLTQVAASLKTYYGTASSAWKLENGTLQLDVTIPANTTATVYVPATAASAVMADGKAVTPGSAEAVSGYVPVTVGSGVYHFTAPAPQQTTVKQ
ncbi:alpha-L-rhamnosidase [Deminuibacter soli]|uniref:alpha-L-rhamnosidase n=1 Tax=Deminuibacter soli TaxID=2291815 RepID=A0A3E1NJ28_9BACT|nr:alpha-L-rhamnosidase [Deminuibacter soli]RFM27788.1 alpha-L-rhamnosidase [Deminuibacter soli]